MTEPLAAAPAAQKSGAAKWIIGCGLGCFVLILIAVAAVVGMGYFAIKVGSEQIKPELTKAYSALKAEGKVPQEHQLLFDELVGLATQPDASFMAAAIGFGVSMEVLKDGQVTADELKQLTDVTELLRQNPDLGFVAAGKFFETHPQLQEVFQRIQQDPNSLQRATSESKPAESADTSSESPVAGASPEADDSQVASP